MEENVAALDIRAINEKIERESAFIDLLTMEMNKVIVGQKHMVERLLIGLLGQGHILLEGVPGLAKTLAINTLSQAVHGSFSRIQFTPDLLPADVIGTMIYNIKANEFSIKKGPIFANFVLADEINRAPAKVQSALLEAMQEKQVTIGDTTFKLDKPFLVLATQNPIEQEGTYPLPEAQLDRFMFAIKLDYPSFAEEVDVVKSTTSDNKPVINPLFVAQEIIDFQHLIRRIPVADNVIEYAVTLVSKTRPNNPLSNDYIKNYLDWGAGPRASQNLILAAKANAAFNGKFSPDIEDVKAVATGILRHRIIKNYKADAEGITEEMIIDKLL
jgi:MoxR-like ATPase